MVNATPAESCMLLIHLIGAANLNLLPPGLGDVKRKEFGKAAVHCLVKVVF